MNQDTIYRDSDHIFFGDTVNRTTFYRDLHNIFPCNTLITKVNSTDNFNLLLRNLKHQHGRGDAFSRGKGFLNGI